MVTLVLGGARSGKSEVAERLAARLAAGQTVTYVATSVVTDTDMEARVATHRARRPAGWTTVEIGGGGADRDLPAVLARVSGVALVDSLGGWVAGSDELAVDAESLCRALSERSGATVVVSEEVGLGVHPSSEAGRRFRDVIGVLNQRVAEMADSVVLVVAGRILDLKPQSE